MTRLEQLRDAIMELYLVERNWIYIGKDSLDERKYPRYRGPGKGFRIEDVIRGPN
jgi:hypothetical protein